MGEQPLLIALVAVQFLVHALGWAMAARLTRRRRAVEGQFALFWLALACGIGLYVPPWPSGSLPRNLGDLLIVGALVLQHRGMAWYWGLHPRRHGYAALLLLTALVVGASLLLPMSSGAPSPHGLRVAAVCVGVGVMLAATVHLLWRHGRSGTPLFAAALAAGYGLLALVLAARAVQALLVQPGTKISIDAAGHSNVPLAILVMFVGGLINLAQIRLVLGRVLHQLTTQAHTDALTGVLNRHGLVKQLAAAHAGALQGGPAYALLMVDVDHFKAVNDRLGHAGGDQVLKRVAQSLRDGVRAGDFVARWGGEEFCVLLPRTSLADAGALAERLLLQVGSSGQPAVSVSIGVARLELPTEDTDGLLRRADDALYRAKQAGRGRVMLAGTP
jgi:diguanylate cyclase (GGDEF)-like protein